MSLTLDPTLAAAQDSPSRRPIVSLNSVSAEAEIPFLGTLMDALTTTEGKAAVITHSTGALCGVMVFGSDLRFFYTDVDRTSFGFVTLTSPSGRTAQEATLVELADGNIGLVLFCSTGTDHEFYRMKLSITGTILVAFTLIFSYAIASHVLACPFVIRLASGTYYLAYIDKTVAGATYAIRYRTSSDFATWSSENTCSIGGLTATKEIIDLSLLQISTAEVWLWFTYVDSLSGTSKLSNVYFSISTDNGVTWASATKRTNYTTYDIVGEHPVAVQKTANQMHLIFNEKKSCMHMDDDATGYCGATSQVFAQGISFDSVHRKLYLICQGNLSSQTLTSVVRVDVDTWTIDACWSKDTTPGFTQIFDEHAVLAEGSHGEGSRVAIGNFGYMDQFHIDVLDGEADTITHYHFHDWSGYGVTRNVNWTSYGERYLSDLWIDGNTNRLYIVLTCNVPSALHIGYIDLTETIGEGGYYTFHDVVTSATGYASGDLNGFDWFARFEMDTAEDLFFLPCPQTAPNSGRLVIHNLSTGGVYKNYDQANYPAFPKKGLTRITYKNGKVYGVFPYDSSMGEEDKRGLCVIDLATNAITFKRPSWATVDDYYLTPMCWVASDTLLLSSVTYGVTTFNVNTEVWELMDNDDIPNLDNHILEDRYGFGKSKYDSTTGIIFTFTSKLIVNAISDLTAFSYLGSMIKGVYEIGTFTTSWGWGSKADFVQGLFDYDAVAALDPSDKSIYAFWTERKVSEYSLKWDKEGASLDLSSYLVRGKEISVRRSIDGSPSELHFAVSSGHLFDPHNSLSLLSIYLKKGRKLVLQFGEKIGGVNYFQDQGAFLVSDLKLIYQRGSYPAMEVTALDQMAFWDQLQIIASASYSDYPEDILTDLLEDFANFAPADIVIPTFDSRRKLYQQWTNITLKDVVSQVCRRFGYFPRLTVGNKFTPRKISDTGSVDHTYSDLTKIIDFTPDDSFSDFTNRVIVEGYERDYIPVLFAEERITTINGTVGWWGFKKDYTIYYSLDKSRTCRSPRMVVAESSQSIMFSLAGEITESISYVDPDEKYCVITVDAPNLIPELTAGMALIVAGILIGDAVVTGGFIVSGGWTRPVGSLITKVGLILCMMTLGSVGNFQYEIWASPVGYVRRSIQGQDDDEDLQAQIGTVVSRKIQDPLIDNVADCNLVAQFEMMVARRQRKGVSFTKVAHLQDEEGDTLQIPHPYTNLGMKIFVTDISRKMLIPSSTGDGYFRDEIQGWNVTT